LQDDVKVFAAMGTTPSEYHMLLRDWNIHRAESTIEEAVKDVEAQKPGAYEKLNNAWSFAEDRYRDAAISHNYASQTLPLNLDAAAASVSDLEPMMKEMNPHFAQLRMDAAMMDIKRLLDEVRSAGPATRAEAAEHIKEILDEVDPSAEDYANADIEMDVVDKLKDPETAHPNAWNSLKAAFSFN
jgi:hypothetical protein